jgi:integrase
VSFVEDHQPTAKEFVTVTPATARAFMDAETERGLAPKTWNDELKLLRTTFKHLHPQLTDGSNPFNGLVTKATEQVRRDPYSVEEMQFILQASEQDPFIRPIILTGMCTAMRRGDCCLLSWDAVDLKDGFVTVKTSKTGETVDIPMFPMLRDLLDEAYAKAKAALPQRKRGRGPQPEPEGLVFPEQAAMYKKTPDGITWRVKKVITEAFKLKAVAAGDIFREASPEEVREKAYEYLASLGTVAKAPRMRTTFDLYMSGLNIDQVAAETGQKKPTVSYHLNEIEDAIELAFIRGKIRLEKKDAVQKGRAEGKGSRRASVRDFHSFRVTWITLALAAGVPLELVQRVTGHKTVEIVLKHYFRPGREDFKQRILAAMPRLLAGPADGKTIDVEAVDTPDKDTVAALDEIAVILKGVTGKANQARVEKALELLKTAPIGHC